MKPIEYNIIRRARRKTASIIVKPDKTIQVVVPAFLRDTEIAALVSKKQRWINNKLAEIDENQKVFLPYDYVEGEIYTFLGNDYQLLTPTGNRPEVILNAETITVVLPLKLPEKAKKQFTQTTLLRWYSRQAIEILTAKTYQLAEEYDLEPTSVGIKDYKSRWGCCFGDGRIYYNWRIIIAPEPVVDYVVVHELCHLAEPNHSKKYWEIVGNNLPNWKEERAWLKRNGFSLDI